MRRQLLSTNCADIKARRNCSRGSTNRPLAQTQRNDLSTWLTNSFLPYSRFIPLVPSCLRYIAYIRTFAACQCVFLATHRSPFFAKTIVSCLTCDRERTTSTYGTQLRLRSIACNEIAPWTVLPRATLATIWQDDVSTTGEDTVPLDGRFSFCLSAKTHGIMLGEVTFSG